VQAPFAALYVDEIPAVRRDGGERRCPREVARSLRRRAACPARRAPRARVRLNATSTDRQHARLVVISTSLSTSAFAASRLAQVQRLKPTGSLAAIRRRESACVLDCAARGRYPVPLEPVNVGGTQMRARPANDSARLPFARAGTYARASTPIITNSDSGSQTGPSPRARQGARDLDRGAADLHGDYGVAVIPDYRPRGRGRSRRRLWRNSAFGLSLRVVARRLAEARTPSSVHPSDRAPGHAPRIRAWPPVGATPRCHPPQCRP
jgi:hypothetical protein